MGSVYKSYAGTRKRITEGHAPSSEPILSFRPTILSVHTAINEIATYDVNLD